MKSLVPCNVWQRPTFPDFFFLSQILLYFFSPPFKISSECKKLSQSRKSWVQVVYRWVKYWQMEVTIVSVHFQNYRKQRIESFLLHQIFSSVLEVDEHCKKCRCEIEVTVSLKPNISNHKCDLKWIIFIKWQAKSSRVKTRDVLLLLCCNQSTGDGQGYWSRDGTRCGVAATF